MNISGIIGILMAIGVFGGSILAATGSKAVFINIYGIMVVIGGTVAATLICLPLPKILILAKAFFTKILGKALDRQEAVIQEIVNLAHGVRSSESFLSENIETVNNPFLKEAIDLEISGGIKTKDIDSMLQMRALTQYRRYSEESNIFKIIGKFPPAFGLMGTTLGMIALLQGIGSPDSFKSLGPAMAIALVTTFYGVALANLILIPVGEALSRMNKDDEVTREIVMAGVKLLRKKEHPFVVEEYLKSYLLPGERDKMTRKAA
jgi:chemotaxis protein MotA